MRFKLVTRHPFSPSKVWFFVEENRHTNVLALKKELVKNTPALRDANVKKPEDFSLLIDDFELLDESAIEVIRDGDMVIVGGRANTSANSKQDTDSQSKTNVRPSVSSSSSSSDSDSSDEDTSSESSSEDSTSSSKSSSVSPSRVRATKDARITSHAVITQPSINVSPMDTLNTVPPGQGKATTHSRNARRRKKRLAERAEKFTSASRPISSSNAVPLGVHGSPEFDSSMTPECREDSRSAPALDVRASFDALRNKNKKKGFKRLMSNAKPQKITFHNDHSGGDSSQNLETESMPSNVIITSVDVEDEVWSETYNDVEVDEEVLGEVNEGDVLASDPLDQSDLDSLGARWESAVPIAEFSGLYTNALVGWKKLGLDPVTMSPELFLHVGVVKNVNMDDKTCLVTAGLFNVPDDGMNEKDVSITFEDAIKAGWRIIL